MSRARRSRRLACSRRSDRFGVVAFDDEVQVVVPAGGLADKHAARHAIASLHSGGMTNLSGGLLRGMQEARRVASDGGATLLLLSDGQCLYAHRSGRTLYLLERHPEDRVRIHRESHETGAAIDTLWGEHRHAILIASEAMTDEPWREIPDGTLLRCDREPLPSVIGQAC